MRLERTPPVAGSPAPSSAGAAPASNGYALLEQIESCLNSSSTQLEVDPAKKDALTALLANVSGAVLVRGLGVAAQKGLSAHAKPICEELARRAGEALTANGSGWQLLNEMDSMYDGGPRPTVKPSAQKALARLLEGASLSALVGAFDTAAGKGLSQESALEAELLRRIG